MHGETRTGAVTDTTVNLWRNVAFTAALLWGFNGSSQRALAVSCITLPLISYVGRLRSNYTYHLVDPDPAQHYPQDQEIGVVAESEVVDDSHKRVYDGSSCGYLAYYWDPYVHLLDVALICLARKSLHTAPVTILWFTNRLLSLWPHEEVNSRHHDSPRIGWERIQNIFDSLSEKLLRW